MWAQPTETVPTLFDIEENFAEAVRFLANVRKKLDRTVLLNLAKQNATARKSNTYFDMSSTRYISPATALVFAAEYDRALAKLPHWNLTTYDLNRWKPAVISTLDQIGFMELLGIRTPARELPKPGSMRISRFACAEGTGNEEAVKLIHSVANLLNIEFQSDDDLIKVLGPVRLFDAIIEATENTRLHAYKYIQPEIANLVVKRWWMAGAADQAEGKLTVIVYDRGATIPATLPHSVHWSKIERAISRLFGKGSTVGPDKDAVSLDLAMASGKSSTGLENRGKGLKVLTRVVDECHRGRLLIMSRRGKFVYESAKKRVYEQLPEPLEGTLVQWDLWRPEWKAQT